MRLAGWYLLLPVVLGIHNAEEYAHYDDFARMYPSWLPARLVSRPIFRNATILLTLAATGLSVSTYVRGSALLLRVSEFAVRALLLNALGHAMFSLKQRTLLPGTLSAITLVLPYSALTLAESRDEVRRPVRSSVRRSIWRPVRRPVWSTIRDTAVAAIATPLTIASFLWISYRLTSPPSTHHHNFR